MQRQFSQQIALNVLENCKQISKDDKLLLRKLVKDRDTALLHILEDQRSSSHILDSKKLQIRLRKYLAQQKENRKIYTPYLKKQPKTKEFQKTIIRKNQKKEPNYQSSQKLLLKEPKRNYTQCYSEEKKIQLSSLHKTQRQSPKSRTKIVIKSHEKILNLAKSESKEHQNLMRVAKSKDQLFQENKVFFPHKTGKGKLKEELIDMYGQDIFEHLTEKYFSKRSKTVVYLPYHKMVQEIQWLIRKKQKSTMGIEQNKFSQLTVLAPFSNQCQEVTFRNLGIFLDYYCMKKVNIIRKLWVLISDIDDNRFSMNGEKFFQMNSWKGKNLCLLYEKIIKLFGIDDRMTYWELYEGRQSKEIKQFTSLYLN